MRVGKAYGNFLSEFKASCLAPRFVGIGIHFSRLQLAVRSLALDKLFILHLVFPSSSGKVLIFLLTSREIVQSR